MMCPDTTVIRRRPALLLGLLLPACAATPPPVPLAPLGFGHLTPLPLNVGAITVVPDDPPVGPGDVGRTLTTPPAEAVRRMARERVSAVGTEGEARFVVTRAVLGRGAGLSCLVACRLEILGAQGARVGFVEAEARAVATGTEASRPDAGELLLRRAMDDLNVEFEYQLRRNLRAWLVVVAPGSGAIPAPEPGRIGREELPRS